MSSPISAVAAVQAAEHRLRTELLGIWTQVSPEQGSCVLAEGPILTAELAALGSAEAETIEQLRTTLEERVQRARRVANAIASNRLEGLDVSDVYVADALDYIAGRIDDTELLARGQPPKRRPASETSSTAGASD